MADYSKIFAGSGGLLSAFSDRSSIINFTTSLAEKAALGLYMNSYQKMNPKVSRNIPNGIEFLAGDNIVSDILRGGYQPHVGAYIAHKVGAATFSAMNSVFDIFSPGMSKSFRNRYEQLKKVSISDKLLNGMTSVEDLNTKYVLESFKTIADQHPEKFMEVFYKQFNSAYMSGDRFFCLLEYDNLTKNSQSSESYDKNPILNRHYNAFLVKNVTIPSADVEAIEFTRFNQKFSIMGNSGFNESISVNYYVDYHNIMYRKLYEQMKYLSFVSDTSRYFTMYIIVNNPYQSMSDFKSDPTGLAGLNAESIKALANFGKIPDGKNNILSVYKFNGVHVKNINQVTYDTASSELLNLPVVFNHNGCDVELFGFDFDHDNKYKSENSMKFDWLKPVDV